MYQAFSGRRALSEREPELRTLFWRLARLLAACVDVVFVFDGPARPLWKRGKRILPHDVWMMGEFQEFVKAFGFTSHQVRLAILRGINTLY